MSENELQTNSNKRNLKSLTHELAQVKESLTTLYIRKSKLEREILDLVDSEIIGARESQNLESLEKIELEIEDLVQIGILYKKKLNHDLLKQNAPDVYMWGRKIVFDFETALLSFRDKRKFWKVIAENTKIEEKITVNPIQKKGKRYARKPTR